MNASPPLPNHQALIANNTEKTHFTRQDASQPENGATHRDENQRVFQIFEQTPKDFICLDCQGLPYALFCTPCRQNVKEKARVNYP